jgi:mitochondrial pyruvate carrier 2
MATPSSTLFRASRPAFRSQFFTPAFRRSAGRRWQSSDAGTGTGGAGGTSGAPNESWFQKAWNSPIGVKTVHFWYAAPPHLRSVTPAPANILVFPAGPP